MSEYSNKDGILLLFLLILTIFYIGIFNKDLENTYGYYLIAMSPFICYFLYKYTYIFIDYLIKKKCNDNVIDKNYIEELKDIQNNTL